MRRPDAPCCCEDCECKDCLHGASLVDGCCHSNLCGDEILGLRKNRPGYDREQWDACTPNDTGQCIDQISCPDGCEQRGVWVTASEDPIQAIYTPLGSFFHVTGGPRYRSFGDPFFGLNHPTRYCNATCTSLTPYCCHDDANCEGADCLLNCVCYEGSRGAPWSWISPYMRNQMSADSQYFSTRGILCYNDGDPSLGEPPTAEDTDVGTGTDYHLFDGYLGHVFLEFWWERASCDGWFLPDPLCEPRDCGAGTCVPIGSDASGEGQLGISNIVPRYWFFGCSGVPIFGWMIARARDNGDIDEDDCQTILGQLGATDDQTQYPDPPDQGIMKTLFDKGYIRTSDWRGELNSPGRPSRLRLALTPDARKRTRRTSMPSARCACSATA